LLNGGHHHHHRGNSQPSADSNVIVIAAAGNTGDSTKIYPAAESTRGLIAVGASTTTDKLAAFSTRGFWIQVLAPGERIVSSIPGGRYGVWRGTSMSAPIVSGVAALIRAKYPNASADEISLRIRQNSAQTDSFMLRRVDAEKALLQIQNPF
jgi:subtilisin family serine protease